jgi:hypothetical protein
MGILENLIWSTVLCMLSVSSSLSSLKSLLSSSSSAWRWTSCWRSRRLFFFPARA